MHLIGIVNLMFNYIFKFHRNPVNHGERKKVQLTKQTGTKILVRNIPFQAKVREVRDLFK